MDSLDLFNLRLQAMRKYVANTENLFDPAALHGDVIQEELLFETSCGTLGHFEVDAEHDVMECALQAYSDYAIDLYDTALQALEGSA